MKWFGVIGVACVGAVLSILVGFAVYVQAPQELEDSETLEDVSYIEPSTPFELGEYHFNSGTVREDVYDLQLAKEYYLMSLRSDHIGNPLTWYQLGRIDFLQGDFPNAILKFNKQLELHGDLVPQVHYMLGLTYGYQARKSGSQDDWERAAEAFIEHIAFAPEAPWPRVDLAWVYFAQGKYEAMLEPLMTGLDFHPNNPWLLNMYGLALLNTDEPARAITQFERARDSAAPLSPEDWGQSYPGNHPESWALGLREFQLAIEKNIEIAAAATANAHAPL